MGNTIVQSANELAMNNYGCKSTSSKCSGGSCPLMSETKPVAPPKKVDEKKCKPCCACPETRKIRDDCIMLNGVENCSKEIEAHRACMKKMGFNI
ncbi:hypothetical protein SNEBB_004008 [Seison nebaliae]|nr:hypothetical protein SNEBB_004008 [Seison nebaliae]